MNSTTAQQRALDILEAALDLPEAEQARFLAEAARDDAAVASELRRLEPARTGTARQLATGGGFAAVAPEAPPPERIGAFRVGRLLGRGGMGSVYEGERADGLFEQRVAIKLLSIRHWSARLEQSIANERRMLARLEHRNIARLYDGGVAADGRSYIVMEKIDGVPITEYADTQRLDLRARVRLFGQLSAALQFAHQQLVIHADIKPSNVLVSPDGSVKLLDFGIAALIQREADSAPTNAATSHPITAAYAPPERAAGDAATVAGDVYSAGIVLRELLAGAREPVPADLASVVGKATAQAPGARYGSVAELREDLSCWLEQLPVHAHPGGWRYRAGRFLARNRLASSLVALIIVGLSVATAVSVRLYLQSERATADAVTRLDELVQLNAFLVDDLSDKISNRPGMVDANWQNLSGALLRLETLARDRVGDIRLQLALARNLVHIAESAPAGYRNGFIDYREIRAKLAATTRRLEALGPDAGQSPEFLAVRADLGSIEAIWSYTIDGDVAAAGQRGRAALALAEAARRRAPESWNTRAAWVRASTTVAATLNAGGQALPAIAMLDALLREAPRSGDASAAGRSYEMRLADADFLRCDVKRWFLADDEALRGCLALEARLRRTLATRGMLIFYESRLAYTLFLSGSLLQQRGEPARALAMLEEARDIYGRILHFGNDEELYGRSLVAESARAATLADLGRLDDARTLAAAVLRARRARLAASPQALILLREVATALRRVGEIELASGKRPAACQAFAEAGDIWSRLEREKRLLAFDLAPRSGQVPWIRDQLLRCR